MACDCSQPVQGNEVYGIPLKIGEPLSSACERASVMGSIPEVIRYPQFTRINGGVSANKISNAGITNPAVFFKSREGCYYDKDARIGGSTCV